ncbi:MAG: magnesium transporter [Gammaproteobacteria bacterium]|nr:magnesium transporter [Gammaproteobacteria bacterium]
MPTQEEDLEQQRLDALRAAIRGDDSTEIQAILEPCHPAEIALLLESLQSSRRERVWNELNPDLLREVLAEVDDSVRIARLRDMAPDELALVAHDLPADDAVDILQDLPDDVMDVVLRTLDEQDRERLSSVLAFAEDSAGGLMNLDVIKVRPDVTVAVVLRYLRRRGQIPRGTNRVMVVDREGRFEGMVRLADLLTNATTVIVSSLIIRDTEAILVDTPVHDVAKLFEQRDLISAPVVDEDNRLLGRITVDDVVDVIRDEGERPLMNLAGLDEEDDIFASVAVTAKRRALWLGLNLATALLAAWVIGLFEATIERVVALAVLMPVVASMGGIAGTQTLTVAIRGMALGHLGSRNARVFFAKETMVGLFNGVLWALLVAVIAGAWFSDMQLGSVVASALILNLIIAAMVGATLPLVLRRLSIDPALAGGVILTMVTDVVGFSLILGLGSILLV